MGVAVAWLNRLSILLIILSNSSFADDSKTGLKWLKKESSTSEQNSPHEKWRQEIFKSAPDKPSCSILSRGLTFDKIKDKPLVETVEAIKNGIADMKWRTLQPLFHPRLKVNQKIVENLFASYEGTYGGKSFDVVPYRVWAINSPEGAAELVECTEDELSIRGFYGYPLQMGVLFQISGTAEIGHAYVSLVPKDGKWVIGAWHRIQWTHLGKDPETWVKEALEDQKSGNNKAGFVKMDIAYKLLNGGAFIYRQLRKDAEATRDSWMSYKDWEEYFKKKLKDDDIVYAGTSFAYDGAGILLRFLVDHNEAANKLREKCIEMGKNIYAEEWTKAIGGLKCQMVTKYEDKTREGVLGGNFISAKDLR